MEDRHLCSHVFCLVHGAQILEFSRLDCPRRVLEARWSGKWKAGIEGTHPANARRLA
jgi:hypothetical protein